MSVSYYWNSIHPPSVRYHFSRHLLTRLSRNLERSFVMIRRSELSKMVPGPCIISMFSHNQCIIKPKFGPKWTFDAYSHVIYHWKGILKHISVVGIFLGETEVESRIIRMNFCIIKPKFGENGLILYMAMSYTVGKVF